MKVKENMQFKRLNLLFNSILVLNLIACIGVGLNVLFSAEGVFFRVIKNTFNSIPYVGGMVYNYVKSLEMIDVKAIWNNVFVPIMGADLVFFVVSFFLLQGLVILLKRYVVKHDHAGFAGFMVFIVLGLIWLTVPNTLFLTRELSRPLVATKDTVLRWLVFFEMLAFAGVLYGLHAENRFNLEGMLRIDRAKKCVRSGLLAASAVMLIITGGLLVMKEGVRQIQNQLHINYVLDFTPNQDGMILLKVPEELSKPLSYVGVTLPDYIDENSVLNQFGIEELDVGAMVNGYTDDVVKNVTYQYVNEPLGIAYTSLIVLLVTALLEFVANRNKLAEPILHGIALILGLWMIFGVIPRFGFLALLSFTFIYVGVAFHLLIYAREHKLIDKIQSTIQHISIRHNKA